MTTKTIVTPRNKRLTPKQYSALVRMMQGRGTAAACENGHFDCAAWRGGPCENAQASEADIQPGEVTR